MSVACVATITTRMTTSRPLRAGGYQLRPSTLRHSEGARHTRARAAALRRSRQSFCRRSAAETTARTSPPPPRPCRRPRSPSSPARQHTHSMPEAAGAWRIRAKLGLTGAVKPGGGASGSIPAAGASVGGGAFTPRAGGGGDGPAPARPSPPAVGATLGGARLKRILSG